jgi:cytochrome b561
MRLMSTTERFGGIAIAFHWVSAALLAVLLGSGFAAAATLHPIAKVGILRVHVLLGIALLALTLARVVWWRFDRKPPPLSAMPRLQERAAKVVHVLFYVLILGMTATGIGTLALSGAGRHIFGAATGPLPDLWKYQPRLEHWIGARVLLVLLAVHIGAALYHHAIRGDGLLRRILPARS